jgi:hypothetical protein
LIIWLTKKTMTPRWKVRISSMVQRPQGFIWTTKREVAQFVVPDNKWSHRWDATAPNPSDEEPGAHRTAPLSKNSQIRWPWTLNNWMSDNIMTSEKVEPGSISWLSASSFRSSTIYIGYRKLCSSLADFSYQSLQQKTKDRINLLLFLFKYEI